MEFLVDLEEEHGQMCGGGGEKVRAEWEGPDSWGPTRSGPAGPPGLRASG